MGIKKLSKNKYHARYFAGYNSKGKRVYPSKTFKTRKDANTWLTAKLREKHLGEYAEASTMSLGQYLEQWMVSKRHSLRENTFYAYQGYLKSNVPDELKRMRLSAIKVSHIEQWQSSLLTKVSARTVASVRVVLGSAFARAVKSRLLIHNPVRDSEVVRFKRAVKQCLSPEQANVFLAKCDGPRGLCLKFMLHTGLRPEELMAVKWANLDLGSDRGFYYVKEMVLRLPGGGWRFDEPKTKNSVRTVGFPRSLVAELKEHRKAQLEARMKRRRQYIDHDLVFPATMGTPTNRTSLTTEFKATLKRAKVSTSMRLYDLRHTFVTLSLAAGVDPKTVSYEAGHSNTAFTLDHYGHVLKVMKEGAVDKREALLAAHGVESR